MDVELAASAQLNKLLPGERVAWKVLVNHATAQLTADQATGKGFFRYDFDAIANNVRGVGAPSSLVVAFSQLFEKIEQDRFGYAAARAAKVAASLANRPWMIKNGLLPMGGSESTTDAGEDYFAGVGRPVEGREGRRSGSCEVGGKRRASAAERDGSGPSGKRTKL